MINKEKLENLIEKIEEIKDLLLKLISRIKENVISLASLIGGYNSAMMRTSSRKTQYYTPYSKHSLKMNNAAIKRRMKNARS